MQSQIQLIAFVMAAALSMQLVAAQPTLQPIEAQFRIVTEYVVRTSNRLVQRCMRYDLETLQLAFVDSTWVQDKKFCQSSDTLFTIVKTQSETEGNLFIGDYSAGNAKQVFVERLPDPIEFFRPFTVNASAEVTRVTLNNATNRLDSLTEPGLTAISNGKILYNSKADKVPYMMRVIPNPLRQFRLKRVDPTTNVTSCATVLDKNGFIGYPSLKDQTVADKRCARNSSIFTFNTRTGQLSIGGRRVRVDEKRRLRAAVDGQPWSPFFLRPESFGFDGKSECIMCRIDGGLMVAQPGSTLTTGPNGNIIASGDYYRAITSEFWPEFI